MQRRAFVVEQPAELGEREEVAAVGESRDAAGTPGPGGFAPAQGQTLAQLLAAHPGSCAVPANLNVVPFPGAPSGVGDAYIKQSVFPSCMADGLPAAEAQVLGATQRPIATIALTQKSGVPAWKAIPSWAVVGTADHAIPPALQLAMAHTRTPISPR